MDILNQVIGMMNKEEVRFLKLYFSRFMPSAERKDLQMFDYVRKSGEEYDEDKIFKKLYADGEKNAFYRLKNRLSEEICKSITLQYYESDDLNKVLYLLALNKFFFNRNKFKLALHFLKKAETKSKKLEQYELLDIIYGEYIKLSHEIMTINPEEYVAKRKQNYQHLLTLRQIDDILAVVSYRLKVNQNFSARDNPVLELLQKTIDDFSSDKEIIANPAFRFRIYQAVSQILLQRRDYNSLEDFLLTTYKQFTREKLFNKSNHNTKLQMLTYLVNTLFAQNKTEMSLQYAEKLQEAMHEFNNLLYDKYKFFYYNALMLNYSLNDVDKGIRLLEELRDKETLKNTPFYEVFLHLNLAILWFRKKEFHQAIKNLNKLYQHEGYKNADTMLKFKIAIAELMIRYELKDYDFLDYKTAQIRKDFRELLDSVENRREKEFLGILRDMSTVEFVEANKSLVAKIRSFITTDTMDGNDDAEVINYSNWLKAKAGLEE